MKLEKYNLRAEPGLTRFEFISEGRNGSIRKLIEFQETTDAGLFNLAFGDKDMLSGKMNDLAVSNNGDTEKVLATVVAALYAFCKRYPMAFVYASGSTKARTRLYRMGISKFIEQVQADFFIYWQLGDEFFEFKSDIDYDGFLVQRKIL